MILFCQLLYSCSSYYYRLVSQFEKNKGRINLINQPIKLIYVKIILIVNPLLHIRSSFQSLSMLKREKDKLFTKLNTYALLKSQSPELKLCKVIFVQKIYMHKKEDEIIYFSWIQFL